jgi:hypothetical protein
MVLTNFIRFLTAKFRLLLTTGLFIQASPIQATAITERINPQTVNFATGEGEVPHYELVHIDDSISGDVKLAGDIDLDGFPDLVVGGMPDEKLNWYPYPDWQKVVIASPNYEFTTDGALGDLDGDGDLDIVVPDGEWGNNLVWFRNPLPDGDPQVSSQWNQNEIGSIGSWGKDVILADFDHNGYMDVATRHVSQAMIFFQLSPGTWSRMSFSGVDVGLEGMAAGDIDNNGYQDLVLHGVWLQNPGDSSSRSAASWSQHTIGDAHAAFKALVVDLNQDGKMDVLFSSSEETAPVDWWTPQTSDPTGNWIRHNILPSLEKAHSLQSADMDLDGDIDIVLAQMHTSTSKEVMVLYNQDGQAGTWTKQVIGQGGSHNSVVVDIGSDGDFDILGANYTGNPPVNLYINQSMTHNELFFPLLKK